MVLKIALVILHADPARGGAERYTHDLAAALVAGGHEVTVAASSFPATAVGRQVLLDARGATRLRKYVRFLDSLDAHLDGETYDIVHAMLPVRRCDVYHPHAGIAAQSVAEAHLQHGGVRRSLVRLGNTLNAKRNRFANVEQELLTGARPPVVLCLSEYVKAALLRFYPLPADRTATLFNAVDLMRFDPSRLNSPQGETRSDGHVTALMVAQDFERKGLKTALLALARVPGLRLVVVGKDDPKPYRPLAEKTGGRVRFAGATGDTWPFYRSADFFVLPTRHDPCSLVVLEALAMGLPVISTKANGACEIMTSGVHGFVLEHPEDVGELADAMGKMMDGAIRAGMRAACSGLRGRLSYATHLERLVEVYQGVCRTRT